MEDKKTNYSSWLQEVKFADDKLPKFTEKKGQPSEMVIFGEANDYPNYLIELFNQSGKHNAIVTGVAAMIKGDGWKAEIPTPALNQWIENPNEFENANDILEKVALDLKLFGGFYILQYWSQDGKTATNTYHLPFEQMRVSSDGQTFERRKSWGLFGDKKDAIKYERFNPKALDRAGKGQVFFYKEYRPGLEHYPLPDYIGVRQYIDTDTEISNFHYNNIKHSFSNSTIVTFSNGVPTLEEQRAIKLKINNQKTGTDNAGGVVLNFVDKKEQAPEIVRLQPDEMDKQYLQLYETTSQEIFIGHRVTSPMIFGVKTAGQLGGRQELMDAKEMFDTDYCKPKRYAIERVFNYLMEFIAPRGKLGIMKGGSMDSQEVSPQAAVQVQQKKHTTQLTEADILGMFDACGEPAENYRIIKQKRLRFGAQENENDLLLDLQFATPLKIEITDAHKKVLSVIKENPQITEAQIANITGLDVKDVADTLTYLSDEGVIDMSNAGYIEITDRGLKTIDEKDIISTEIFVKYKYDGTIIPTTRPFCRTMLGKNRLFTREDIDNVSAAAGYNVWAQRGGWYHNPNTDVNTPYCRHFWSQVIVKKKVKK